MEPSSPPPPNRTDDSLGWRWLTGGVLLYSLLAVVFTYPAIAQLDSHLFGARRDAPMFLWNSWWGPTALFEWGQNPLFTTHLFHPLGASLTIHTHSLFPGLLMAPLAAVAGLVPSFNLGILLTFVFSGLAMALLVFDVVKDKRTALWIGALYAFGHHRVSMILFLNLIQTHLLVFFVWTLWRGARSPSRGWGIAGGVLAGALAYTSYNLLLFAILFSTWWVVVVSLRCSVKREPWIPRVRQWAWVASVAALCIAPLAWETWQEIDAHGYYATKTDSHTYNKTIPLSRFLLRNPLQEGAAGVRLIDASFLGYTTMLLVLTGMFVAWRRRSFWFWTLTAGAFLVFALGARLSWDIPSPQDRLELAGFPLPYQWIPDLPLLGELRNPHRFGLIGWPALCVAASFGLAWWFRRSAFGHRLGSGILSALVLGGMTFDFLQVPFPKLRPLPPVPEVIQQIADDDRDCSVFEYPAGRLGNPAFSYFETIHEKPVYGDGQLARLPPHLESMRKESILRQALGQASKAQSFKKRELVHLAEEISAEVRDARLGWVLLSWMDSDPLADPDLKALKIMDKVIRATLPVDRVVFQVEPQVVTEWATGKLDERLASPCLYAVYRLNLPE